MIKMVFGIGKKKEYHVGDEILPGGKIRYPGSDAGTKIKHGLVTYGKVLGKTYLNALKGKDYETQLTEIEAKKEKVQKRLKLAKAKYEISKMKNTISKLESHGRTSNTSGIEILKKINVPDYLGINTKIGSSNVKVSGPRKKQAWEII